MSTAGQQRHPSADKEALRVQAAAVAAQQAALWEEEIRLEQQRALLQQQHAQLADHLDQKEARLLQLGERVREARATFQLHIQQEREQLAEFCQQLHGLADELTDQRACLMEHLRTLVNYLRLWERAGAAETRSERRAA